MDKELVSSWFSLRSSVPESYVLPQDKRPGNVSLALGESIPVVDLSHDRTETTLQIMEACQEFGFFQVINHGVCEDLMDETMDVIKEFNAMPGKEKVLESSRDPNKSCWLYTSSGRYATEEVHYWRDGLMHYPCLPLDKYIKFWPQKPTKYREVMGTFSIEVKKLSSWILEMICEGLGLDPMFFADEMSSNPMLLVNHYPPCPDPSLTLGMSRHYDPSVITIVLQAHVNGLQVFKDEKWISVDPIPHAFVVNIGHVLQVISNGKLKSAEHRVVTNSRHARTTASLFINPSEDTLIEPARSLLEASNDVPIFGAVPYKVFRNTYLSTSADAEAVKKLMIMHLG